MNIVQTVLKIIKNTHRHPVNQALHTIAAPFYVLGIAMMLGHLVGMQTDLAAAGTMVLGAVGMFVLGHKIEGNLRSMAPLLLFRFLRATIISRRKIASYPFANQVHLLRS